MSRMFTAVLRRSLPVALASGATLLASYVMLQQHERLSADDLPAQIAQDVVSRMRQGVPASSLVGGVKIDPRTSLAPFLIVMDGKGVSQAASFSLGSDTPHMPASMLQRAKEGGEYRVTWEPERGVRIATTVVYAADAKGGTPYFVISGHSLREVEKRTALYGELALLGWIASVILAAGASALAEGYARA
jgi:hypothetical protein